MRACKDAGKNLLDQIWVDADKSVDPAYKKFRSRLCAREYKTKRQGKIDTKSLTCFSVVLCNATLWSCKSVGLNHDVCWLVEHRDTIEVEGLRHQQSAFPSNSPETRKCPSSSGRSTVTWCRRSWQIDQKHPWNSRHITSDNLTT